MPAPSRPVLSRPVPSRSTPPGPARGGAAPGGRAGPRRGWRTLAAGLLLCAAGSGAAAEAASPAPSLAVDLGGLTFPVEGARQVTHVVLQLVAGFADAASAAPYQDEGGVIRLRDAALGAVRDLRPEEVAEPIDVAALERRLRRAMARRTPGLEEVRLQIFGLRSEDRR